MGAGLLLADGTAMEDCTGLIASALLAHPHLLKGDS